MKNVQAVQSMREFAKLFTESLNMENLSFQISGPSLCSQVLASSCIFKISDSETLVKREFTPAVLLVWLTHYSLGRG